MEFAGLASLLGEATWTNPALSSVSIEQAGKKSKNPEIKGSESRRKDMWETLFDRKGRTLRASGGSNKAQLSLHQERSFEAKSFTLKCWSRLSHRWLLKTKRNSWKKQQQCKTASLRIISNCGSFFDQRSWLHRCLLHRKFLCHQTFLRVPLPASISSNLTFLIYLWILMLLGAKMHQMKLVLLFLQRVSNFLLLLVVVVKLVAHRFLQHLEITHKIILFSLRLNKLWTDNALKDVTIHSTFLWSACFFVCLSCSCRLFLLCYFPLSVCLARNSAGRTWWFYFRWRY